MPIAIDVERAVWQASWFGRKEEQKKGRKNRSKVQGLARSIEERPGP